MVIKTVKMHVLAKLVDEERAKKLEERREQLMQSYRPQQGWLAAPENKVERLR